LAAYANQNNSSKHCGSAVAFADPNACTPEGVAFDRAAQSYRTATYWSVGLGAGIAAVGAVLLLVPSRKAGGVAVEGERAFAVAPILSRGASGLSIQTTW